MSARISSASATAEWRGPALVAVLGWIAGGLPGQSSATVRAQVACSRVVNAIANELFSRDVPGDALKARELLLRTAAAAASLSANATHEDPDIPAMAEEINRHYTLLVDHSGGEDLAIYYEWIRRVDGITDPRVVACRVRARARLFADLNRKAELSKDPQEHLGRLSEIVAAVGRMQVEETELARQEFAGHVKDFVGKLLQEEFWSMNLPAGTNHIEILGRFSAGVAHFASASITEPLITHVDQYFARPAGKSETLVQLYQLFCTLAVGDQLQERLQGCQNLVKIAVNADGVDVPVAQVNLQVRDPADARDLPELNNSVLQNYFVPVNGIYRIRARARGCTMHGLADIKGRPENGLCVNMVSNLSQELGCYLEVDSRGEVVAMLFPCEFWTNGRLKKELAELLASAVFREKDRIKALTADLFRDQGDEGAACRLTSDQTIALSDVLGSSGWKVPTRKQLVNMSSLLRIAGRSNATPEKIACIDDGFDGTASLLLYKVMK